MFFPTDEARVYTVKELYDQEHYFWGKFLKLMASGFKETKPKQNKT